MANILNNTDRLLKAREIRNLRPIESLLLSLGEDHLDLISLAEYGSHDYWSGIAIYNNIYNPFFLIKQGITEIQLFDQDEYNKIVGI